MSTLDLILSCEHASANIPSAYQPFFNGSRRLLASHRAYDIGALSIFKALKPQALFSCVGKQTRLLVDLNRSLHHRHLIAECFKGLSDEQKTQVIDQFYHPYREAVFSAVSQSSRPLHIACHSFTPVLDGVHRVNDIGLLYDPASSSEKRFCALWRKAILEINPRLVVRMNMPYRGVSDGLPTSIRRAKLNRHYIGIELEVNQCHFTAEGLDKSNMAMVIRNSLLSLMREF